MLVINHTPCKPTQGKQPYEVSTIISATWQMSKQRSGEVKWLTQFIGKYFKPQLCHGALPLTTAFPCLSLNEGMKYPHTVVHSPSSGAGQVGSYVSPAIRQLRFLGEIPSPLCPLCKMRGMICLPARTGGVLHKLMSICYMPKFHEMSIRLPPNS